MNTRFALAALLAAAPLVVAAQQPLQLVFRIDSGGTVPWFAADSSTRGMALVPGGDLLVADRGPGHEVYRLDATTGLQTGKLDMTGVADGTYFINKIVCAQDGKIYLANLSSDGKPLRLYYYDSVDAAPFLLFEEPAPAVRWGDGLAVTGEGSSTRILITGSGNPDVMILEDTDGDGEFSPRVVSPVPALTGHNEAAWDISSSRFWLRQATAANLPAYQYDAATGERTGIANALGSMYGAIDIAPAVSDRYVMGVVPVFTRGGETNLPGYVFGGAGTQSSAPLYATSTGLEKPGGAAENINGSGEVVIDRVNHRVYFLMTNNSISGWDLPDGVLP